MFTNYRFVVTPTKVIALSSFAGRTVRGVAKCHPGDSFDEEFGKRLAAARCNKKIAEKRYARAQSEYDRMCKELTAFREKAHKTCDYLKDAYERNKDAAQLVEDIRSELGDC